jgi:phosphoribosylamine--glycine ligase
VGVVLASEGYPAAPVADRLLEDADPSGPSDDGDVLCFHAATRRTARGFETSGGRVVTFVGRGSTFSAARKAVYREVESCQLDGCQYRTDIGLREVEPG